MLVQRIYLMFALNAFSAFACTGGFPPPPGEFGRLKGSFLGRVGPDAQWRAGPLESRPLKLLYSVSEVKNNNAGVADCRSLALNLPKDTKGHVPKQQVGIHTHYDVFAGSPFLSWKLELTNTSSSSVTQLFFGRTLQGLINVFFPSPSPPPPPPHPPTPARRLRAGHRRAAAAAGGAPAPRAGSAAEASRAGGVPRGGARARRPTREAEPGDLVWMEASGGVGLVVQPAICCGLLRCLSCF